jgi:hypothetical protein
MTTRKALSTIFGFGLALALFAPLAQASQRDQASQLTFSQPVQIPGDVILPPGTYWFTIEDNAANRNLVRVFDSNWQPVASLVTTTASITEPSDNTLLVFAERSPNQAVVLLDWFYPGDSAGHEFVYSGAEGQSILESTTDYVTVTAQPTSTMPTPGY